MILLFNEMNFLTIVISVIISLICILVALLQHYYIYLFFNKATDVMPYAPVFEDMFHTEDELTSDTNNSDWELSESEILNSLDEALKVPLTLPPEACSILLNKDSNGATAAEVQNSLQAALAYKLSGKMDKANKLFERAASIAPDNPDVLNRYGEFIEHMHNDVIAADELYHKALMHAPNHEAALVNSERTSHLVDKMDFKIFQSIDEKLVLLKKIQQSHPFYDIVSKQAYYLHVYHTVGIEGNTMTIEQLRYLLDTGLAVHGKSLLEHNEIIGLQLAMKYVKLLTRFPQIKVKEILGIHRRVLGHVDPLYSGIFREKQVFVSNHVPPPPEDIPALIESFVEWLNSEEAHSMHPVRYAALAHYKLVDIHPFSDGNGRTSRLIMNLILLRAGYPPVMILKDHREQYYQYLKLANKGDVRPFIRFIAHCTSHMIEVYLTGIQKYDLGITTLNSDAIETNVFDKNT